MAETLHVTQAGAGSRNGLDLVNAWSASDFNTAANWGVGVGKISAGDTILLGEDAVAFSTKLTIQGSGTSTAARIILKGNGAISGTSAAPIWTGTTTLVGIDGGSFDYIAVIRCELRQLSAANNYDTISWSGCDGWLVQDNYIHDTYGNGIATTGSTFNNDNIIRHNFFYRISYVGDGAGGGVCTAISGARNIREYNIVLQSTDRFQLFGGAGNAVRNNYLGATDTTGVWLNYPSQQPPHIDDIQTHGSGSAVALTQTLFEKNYSIDNGPTTDAHLSNMQDTTANGFEWFLMRFNIVIRVGGGLLDYANFDRTYHYNNTWIAIENGSGSNFNTTGFWDHAGGSSDLADVRNCTWSYCPKCLESTGLLTSSERPTNFTSGNNHSFNSGTQSGLPAGASPPNLSQIDPKFNDGTGVAGHDDYTLRPDSPLKATGTNITAVNGSVVSSLTVVVVDAKRLVDGRTASGWAAIDADWVKFGSGGSYVQITSIDYPSNTLTFASPVTATDGTAVFVKGMEDVGALPFLYVVTPTVLLSNSSLSAGANTLSAAVNNTDAVRFVEYMVDGLPVGSSFTSPYNVSYMSDGASHVVTARAYNAWASATLIVESTKTLSGGTVPIRSAIYAGKTVQVTPA